MNHPERETATNPAFTQRETRATNPYDRILYAGADSNRFAVLRKVFTRGRSLLKPWGAFDTLEQAIAARDAVPLTMHPRRGLESMNEER